MSSIKLLCLLALVACIVVASSVNAAEPRANPGSTDNPPAVNVASRAAQPIAAASHEEATGRVQAPRLGLPPRGFRPTPLRAGLRLQRPASGSRDGRHPQAGTRPTAVGSTAGKSGSRLSGVHTSSGHVTAPAGGNSLSLRSPFTVPADGQYRGQIAGYSATAVYLTHGRRILVLPLSRSTRILLDGHARSAWDLAVNDPATAVVRRGVLRLLDARRLPAEPEQRRQRAGPAPNSMGRTAPSTPASPPSPTLPAHLHTQAAAVAASSSCPSGWNCADIGSPAIPGSESYSNESWTITGAGAGVGGTSDQFHFDWQAVSTDSRITVHLSSLSGYTGGCAGGGVMYRASTDPAAVSYMIMAHRYCGTQNGAASIHVVYRTTQGGPSTDIIVADGNYVPLGSGYPLYLRVTREGNTFAGYYSFDGVNWTYLVNSSAAIGMPDNALLGVAASSYSTTDSTTGSFDTITIDSTPNSCPSGWSCAAVGNPAMPGAQQVSNGNWAIEGAGGGIGGGVAPIQWRV